MKATWLPDALEAEGVHVALIGGWEARGGTLTTIQGVVCHHTATGPNWGDAAVLNMLVNGRPDLRGPLAQIGLSRDGTAYVVASGRANHNGYGTWGNQSIGIEAFNSGTGEPWPEVQLEAYHRCSAAVLRHERLPVDRCAGHKETDPRRKIDPAGIDMGDFRRRVQAVLDGEDDDMPSIEELRALQAEKIANDNRLHEDFTKRQAETNKILREIRDRLPEA